MPRETLTRDRVVLAAVELLDAEGVDGLSMRRLGERLGSAATAVYWHVGNKENLVSLACDRVWDELPLPDPDTLGWRAAASAQMVEAHAMFRRHRWVVHAMTGQPVYGPGIARYRDHAYAIYEAAGFADAELDWALHTVFTFLLGQATADTADLGARTDAVREDERMSEIVSSAREIAERFPRLRARIAALESEDQSGFAEQGFAFGLDVILDGLEARVAARSAAQRG
ncbi:TetR/AcrR family transcriptional regulator C-terminal domain-containing protein [Kutzneria sp. 744]|uniref:TetR/AcrR family transcriptional regulator C-terminal domain-containing protein n=1 Tax=Kutzneria sp. (strain 744) TaxID=345341 RepID=UPI0004BC368F|nr:TetR/AcrR family transcriptional regulator C-terminal domain-containing protein [Kutzneria sp. 744]